MVCVSLVSGLMGWSSSCKKEEKEACCAFDPLRGWTTVTAVVLVVLVVLVCVVMGKGNTGDGVAEATAVSVSTEQREMHSADTERLADKCPGRGAAAWSEATVV